MTEDNILWRKNRGKPSRRCKKCYTDYQNALKKSANHEHRYTPKEINPHPSGVAVHSAGWGWTPTPAKSLRVIESFNKWHQ